MAEDLERLLVGGEEEEWDKVEEGHNHDITVQELIANDPDGVVAYLKASGVSKLGEFSVPVRGRD